MGRKETSIKKGLRPGFISSIELKEHVGKRPQLRRDCDWYNPCYWHSRTPCRKETSIKKGLRLQAPPFLLKAVQRRKETSIKKGLRPPLRVGDEVVPEIVGKRPQLRRDCDSFIQQSLKILAGRKETSIKKGLRLERNSHPSSWYLSRKETSIKKGLRLESLEQRKRLTE